MTAQSMGYFFQIRFRLRLRRSGKPTAGDLNLPACQSLDIFDSVENEDESIVSAADSSKLHGWFQNSLGQFRPVERHDDSRQERAVRQIRRLLFVWTDQ